jgi:hypothetical protein
MLNLDISDDDLFMLLCSAVRYALGRRTYVVEWTTSLVRRLWPRLKKEQRNTLLRDVREAVERAEAMNTTVGMPMDHETWTRLIADLVP